VRQFRGKSLRFSRGSGLDAPVELERGHWAAVLADGRWPVGLGALAALALPQREAASAA